MLTIASWLSADHERLGALLAQATARADAIYPAPYADFRRGLLRHIAIEEKLLLPAAQRARGGEPLPLAARLRLDHGALAALLVPSPTPAIVARISSILARHNALEEGPLGLYAVCDRLLGDGAEALVAEMRAYPEPRMHPHNDAPDVMPAVARALERAGYRLPGDAEE